MRLRSGMILAIGAGLLVLGGCAAAAGPAGPTTSPTGRVYEPGTAPSQTRNSQTATLHVARGEFDQALAAAQQGIAADSANPVHYYLAAQAYAGLGDYDAADRMFDRAEEIYPAYELEIEPERERAWGIAFNEGVEAYQAGDLETAAAAWERANVIYTGFPESYMNLAILRAQAEDYDASIEAYQAGIEAAVHVPAAREMEEEEIQTRAAARETMTAGLAELLLYRERFAEAEDLYRRQLETDPDDPQLLSQLAVALARQGKEDEAGEIYGRVLSQPDLTPLETFNIGVALFNAQAFEQAAEAFRRVTEAQPNSRDAWYNYVTSLYRLERFDEVVEHGARLVELDPLHENSALFFADGLRHTGETDRGLTERQRNAAQPVHLEQFAFQPRAEVTRLGGVVVGNEAAPGTPVQIRFNFYGASGALGSETVTVTAPARGSQTRFEVTFQGPATHYNYELVD
jgi:tetratricopeptide (TPR) repeat protein